MRSMHSPAAAGYRRAAAGGAGTLGFLVVAVLTGVTPAAATPTYTLTFRVHEPGPLVFTGSTPIQQTDSYTLGNTSFSADGSALPGHIRMHHHMEAPYPGDASAGEARAEAVADDFLITGPSGPTVTGTMYFHASAMLATEGGLAGTSSTGSGGWESFTWVNPVQPVSANGQCWLNNFNSGGTGFMSTYVAPGSDFDASITADFPVGVPFQIKLSLDVSGGIYSGPANSPASEDEVLTGVIGSASGHVIDLPPGYSLSSAEWNISGNDVLSIEPGWGNADWAQVKALYH